MVSVAGLAAVVALAVMVSLRPGGRRPTPVADAEVQARAEELRAAAARVEEVERRKKDLEAQVHQLEHLTAGSPSRVLTTLDETARSLGVDIREITLNEGRLKVTFRAASLEVGRRLATRLEEQGVVVQPVLESRGAKTFMLTATVR